MRKVILNLAVTLDGFIEGANGEVDWCRMDADPGSDAFFDKFLAGIDTIFYGRISYDLWGQYQPAREASLPEKKLWEAVHSKEKFVFSRSLKADHNATYISSNISARVTEVKNKPGRNIWLYGGANLISEFINLDLVDTYLLAVFPVILGSGKPLFSNVMNRVNLSLSHVETSASGVILLCYDRKK